MSLLERLNKTSIKLKMIIAVLSIASICIAITLFVSYTSSREALKKQAIDQLNSIQSISRKRVDDFFGRTHTFAKLLGNDRLTEGLFLSYESAYMAAGNQTGQDIVIKEGTYKKLDEIYHSKTAEILKSYNLANYLLVSIQGQILYSAKGDAHGYFMGRSLTGGELKDSELAKCVSNAQKSKTTDIFYSDYSFYPQFNKTMAFYCVNSYAEFAHLSEGINKGDLMGTVVIEVDTAAVTQFLSAREGMGETGQAYLIGPDHLLRSDFYINKEKFNIVSSHKNKVQLKSIKEVDNVFKDNKEISLEAVNELGHKVLTSIAPIEVEGKTWAVVVEKQATEVYKPIADLLKKVFLFSAIVLAITFFLVIFITKKLLAPIITSAETLASVCQALNSDSNFLSQNAQTLNSSAKDQSTDLATTVQAVHEISATIEQNTSNAKNSEELAKHSLDTAERGRQVIQQMIESMKEINQGNQDIILQVEDSNKKINEILGMISEIGNKTKMINDIVFQTKLLSFNASVEAARAGENGKGFAVVAEEVGNLATSSGNSAKEIGELLTESIERVESIVKETASKIETVSHLGRERVRTGQETAIKCSEVFDEIVKSFNQVASMVSEISMASNEQNQGMSGINEAMARLNVGTDKSTQIASESSQAANKLENQAKTLEEVVQNIQQVIHGT